MLTINNISELDALKESTNQVALIVYGDSCVPCQQLKQYVQEDIEQQFLDLTFVAMSGTQNRDWAISQGIRTVPTTILYDFSTDASTSIKGFNPGQKESYIREIKAFLNNTL